MRRLGKQDMEEILALRAKRVLLKDIAERFRVSDAQISNIINGKHIPRRLANPPNPHAPVVFQEEDFSSKPDDVLFSHTKACDFIG